MALFWKTWFQVSRTDFLKDLKARVKILNSLWQTLIRRTSGWLNDLLLITIFILCTFLPWVKWDWFMYSYRTVGEIFTVSLAQGGPAPAFLKEWCYNFLCSGEMNFSHLSKEDVADLESVLLINKVIYI